MKTLVKNLLESRLKWLCNQRRYDANDLEVAVVRRQTFDDNVEVYRAAVSKTDDEIESIIGYCFEFGDHSGRVRWQEILETKKYPQED